MSGNRHDLAAATARTRAARARLMDTLGQLHDRLRPSTLAQDAVESAAQGVATVARRGADAVRRRPIAIAAFAGTVGLVMARGWIADIVGGRGKHATGEQPKGLKPETDTKSNRRAPRAKKGAAK